jgi:3-hydroxyacyl-[acyl-carrier-protein] dehydratase
MRFQLVDAILELEPGKRVVAIRDVSPDDDYFADHFPGFPVVPGVLLTETMGQAAAKCLDAERRPRGKAMLATIRSATFRDWVRPGARLTLFATIKINRDELATAECRADVEGKTVAQAELLFSFVPFATFGEGYRDEVLDRFLAERQAGVPERG